MATDIPTDVLNALKETLDPESVGRIMFFLCQSIGDGLADPYIRSLQSVLEMSEVFTEVAKRIAEDTKKADKDPQYKQFMQTIWSRFLNEDVSKNHQSGQTWDLGVPGESVGISAQHAFMRAVANLPPESYVALQGVLKSIASAGPLVVYADRALNCARSAAPVVRVALVTAYLAYDVIRNIARWLNGEISGTRCVANIINSGVSVASGVAGGIGGEIVGASIGGVFGPVGIGVGAVAGAIFGSAAGATGAQILSDRLTQWYFGLPKSEALENAYRFLSVAADASNSAINSRYRHLALQYHPDKGGDPEKWTQLQYSLAIIREARGEI